MTARPEDYAPRDYLLWSTAEQQWWGPERAGFKQSVRFAGRYTRREAIALAAAAIAEAGPQVQLPDIPVRLEDAEGVFAVVEEHNPDLNVPKVRVRPTGDQRLAELHEKIEAVGELAEKIIAGQAAMEMRLASVEQSALASRSWISRFENGLRKGTES